MSALLPLASYNLALTPFTPTQAIESDLPVTVHITLAAIDPSGAIDDDEEPSTLRILKSSVFSNLDSDDESDDDELDEDNEDAALNDESIGDADSDEDEEDDEQENEDASEDEDEDDDEDDVEEFVVCTLGPKAQYQQTLDITISPDEEVYFVVTGSYPIHITGNYVEHPYDADEDDFDSDDDEDEDDYYNDEDASEDDEVDLTPDEDELVEGFDIDDLDEEEDVEGRIEELIEEDEKKQEEEEEEVEEPKLSKKAAKKAKKDAAAKKRQAETEEEPVAEPKSKKQKQEEKNVQFNKELEQGPTKSKPTTKTLAGGIVVEDRTVGKGPVAKNGSKVGVRYIGKLKNGSVFDKNTSGKPFNFNLGKGEVIKGWDIGVAGMAVGGERRIVIPAPFAYGKKKLPGIPANSELTFDVKLVSLK